MLAHLLIRLQFWPEGDVNVMEPDLTAEDCIEHTFGEIKSFKRGSHGTATTSIAIQGTQLVHARRAQELVKA